MTEMPVWDHRMSDAESLMWRLEKDPYLSSTFANITLLDTKPDVDRLLRRMERATHAIPRLRQRVQPAPGGLGNPTWVDDPGFDLRYHVRHIALPKPGTMRQLLDLAAQITNDAFDRTRPLWQFVVVDGLRGGKSALIEKLHHTIVDGEAGVKLSLEFLDFQRDAPEPAPIAHHSLVADPEADTPVDIVRELLAASVRMPLTMLKQAKDLMSDGALQGVARQLTDHGAAQSPLWTQRSLGRRVEVLRAPFDRTRESAKRLGGTLNTAFLAAAADAAGRYHRELGHPIDTLRASMAISTRTEGSGANAFSLARFTVPTAEIPMGDRFRLIHAAAEAARQESGGSAMNALSAVAANLPTSLITRIARQQSQTVDFATSNVRGAPMPLYLAGAQILQNYPVGPLAGVAFNLTLLSYDHSLDMGVNIDTAAVEQPEVLRACLEHAFRDLLTAD
jgi:WS/DGAT/MGAT family acyltransferase